MDKSDNLIYITTYRGVSICRYKDHPTVISFNLDDDDEHMCGSAEEAKEIIDATKNGELEEYLERKTKEAYWAYCDSFYKAWVAIMN